MSCLSPAWIKKERKKNLVRNPITGDLEFQNGYLLYDGNYKGKHKQTNKERKKLMFYNSKRVFK